MNEKSMGPAKSFVGIGYTGHMHAPARQDRWPCAWYRPLAASFVEQDGSLPVATRSDRVILRRA